MARRVTVDPKIRELFSNGPPPHEPPYEGDALRSKEWQALRLRYYGEAWIRISRALLVSPHRAQQLVLQAIQHYQEAASHGHE